MRLTNIGLETRGGQIARVDSFPQELANAYKAGNLDLFQKTLSSLRSQGGLPIHTLPAALVMASQLSLDKSNIKLAWQYSKELLLLPQTNENFTLTVLDFLGSSLASGRRLKHPDYAQICRELSNFFGNSVVPTIAQKSIEEQGLWLNMLAGHIDGFILQKISLCERIFGGSKPGDLKLLSVLVCINLAVIELKKNNGFQVNQEMVKQMAAYYIEGQLPECIDQPDKFELMLANFGYLGLAEEMSAAIEKANLDKGHIARKAWLIISTYQQKGAKAAYELCDGRENTRLTSIKGKSIESLIVWLWHNLCDEILMQKQVVSPLAMKTQQEGRCMDQFLQMKRKDYPDIISAARELRLKTFEAMARPLDNFAFTIFCSSFLEQVAKGIYATVVWKRGAEEMYVYFENKANSDQIVRVRFEAKRSHGEVRIRPDGIFDEVSKEEKDNLPLLWEMVVLESLLATLLNGIKVDDSTNSRMEFEWDKIIKQVRVHANRMSIKQNQGSFDAFLAQFSPIAGYRDLIIKAENQSRILAQILERQPADFVEIGAKLIVSDFLSPLVEKIHIFCGERCDEKLKESVGFSRDELEKIKKQAKKGFPMLVLLQPKQGKEIYLILTGLDQIMLPGVDQPPDPYLSKFIIELVLQVLVGSLDIKEEEKQQTAGPSDPPGYVIDEQGALSFPAGMPASSLKRLMDIHQALFYQQMMKSGVMGEKWYEYLPNEEGTDGVYRPFDDQSIEAKHALLGQRKPESIFISDEPNGIITRLPVGVKRQGKKTIIAPLERSSLREEQQRYFNDFRPLPQKYAVYIITEFEIKKGKKRFFHLFPVEVSVNELEMFELATSDELNAKLGAGKFKDPHLLFSKTEAKKASRLRDLLKKRQIKIVDQTVDMFTVNYTYRRPEFKSVAWYLEEGFKLENEPKN